LSNSIHRLLPLFERAMARAEPLVLGTVIDTSGPTYTKAGAQMLLASDGEAAGLLSGGCLEGDLAEHAREVRAGGAARLLRYDMRGPDDLVFGLGSGCEGAMDILLQRLDATVAWQPLAHLVEAWRSERSETVLLVVRSPTGALPAGSGMFLGNAEVFGVRTQAPGTGTSGEDGAVEALQGLVATLPAPHTTQYLAGAAPNMDLLVLHQPAPVRILILGAGDDAQPVAQFAHALGWRVTVVDHRSHYATPTRFPGAPRVLDGGPASLGKALAHARTAGSPYAAAVVMSHHLEHDRVYLQLLADDDIPYVGLLGPGSRRERLLADMGDCAARLKGRLRAPVGLDLGAGTPEAIALAIIAEIQATLTGRRRIAPLGAVPA
jgi:xanthine dehydrogenase accessory factor